MGNGLSLRQIYDRLCNIHSSTFTHSPDLRQSNQIDNTIHHTQPTNPTMFKSNKESRYADTPVSPAVETSVVHSFREEVTLLGNRRICDEAPNSNPLGRLDAD